MFVLGLILMLLAAGSLVAVIASGTDDRAALYGGDLTVPTLVVFLAGAAALLLLVVGLELVRTGIKRANQNRLNKKKLRRLEKERPAPAAGGTERSSTATHPSTSSANGPAQDPPGR